MHLNALCPWRFLSIKNMEKQRIDDTFAAYNLFVCIFIFCNPTVYIVVQHNRNLFSITRLSVACQWGYTSSQLFFFYLSSMSFSNGYDRFIIIIRVMLNAVNIPYHAFSEAGLRCRIYISGRTGFNSHERRENFFSYASFLCCDFHVVRWGLVRIGLYTPKMASRHHK